MVLVSLTLATALLLCAAGYAQYRIPRFTAPGRVMLTRAILISTGIAFGIAAIIYSGDSLPAPLVFLSAFGLVHVPAAFILLLKRLHGEGRT
jgi:hypothetical protein